MDNLLAYLIPVVLIIGGITYAILTQYFRTKRRIAELAHPSALRLADDGCASVDENLTARVDALEARVRDVESGVERSR